MIFGFASVFPSPPTPTCKDLHQGRFSRAVAAQDTYLSSEVHSQIDVLEDLFASGSHLWGKEGVPGKVGPQISGGASS